MKFKEYVLNEGFSTSEVKSGRVEIGGKTYDYRIMKGDESKPKVYTFSSGRYNAEIDLDDKLPGGAVIWWTQEKPEPKLKKEFDKIFLNYLKNNETDFEAQTDEAYKDK